MNSRCPLTAPQLLLSLTMCEIWLTGNTVKPQSQQGTSFRAGFAFGGRFDITFRQG